MCLGEQMVNIGITMDNSNLKQSLFEINSSGSGDKK